MKGIEKEKIELDRQKKKIQLKEKILKEKEKQQRARKFKDVGRIAFKANIDQLDKDVLLGSFLEIAENKNDENLMNRWKKKAEKFSKRETTKETPLSVSFGDSIEKEAQEVLRKLNFKWNKFRKEFYGYSCKKSLEEKLRNFDQCKIEVVD